MLRQRRERQSALKGTLLADVILALLLGLSFFSFLSFSLAGGWGETLLQFHDPARAVSGSSAASIVAALLGKHLTKCVLLLSGTPHVRRAGPGRRPPSPCLARR